MKRYRIEQRRPYADDPESVFEVPVEDEAGDWVPADVAQGLYDALAEMVECFGDVSFPTEEEREADEDVIAARAALAKADQAP